MRVTKWGEYGILFCLYLAKAGKEFSVGAAELADFHNIPLQYAQQILQRLRKGGLIRSIRGPGGGYQLVDSPKKVNLKQVLYAVEGGTFSIICEDHPLAVDVCASPGGCALHHLWFDLRKSIDTLLERQTLASMLVTHASDIPSRNGKTPSKLVRTEEALT